MAALMRPAGVLVGALVAVATGVTLGVTHVPHVKAAHAAAIRPGSTSSEEVDAVFVARLVPTPEPTPVPTATPEPVVETAAPQAAPAPPPARVAAPAPAPPQAVTIGSTQQALINQDRAAAGLPPLSWSSCLSGIAAGQSQAMASAGRIYHGNGVNQDFGCGLGSGQTGENVGYWTGGVNDGQLNTMFMNSPDHRANIMGPYRFVGTAWVTGANGTGYISVEFG